MAIEQRFDVLIIGAGPAGIAAAIEASKGGGKVGIVDDNPTLGGQIWRGAAAKPDKTRAADAWIQRAKSAGVEFVPGARVFAQPSAGMVWAETYENTIHIQYNKLVLATGARELFLPFPGWTLPNVMGAGGLQALVKSGLPISGKRVVVAGSGPLLLAVAAGLREYGAKVQAIIEQAPRLKLLTFGLNLLTSPSKLRQAIALKTISLRGIPYRTGSWPVAALGEGRLEGVRLDDGRRTWEIPCDYLACGFGLVPNSEIARMFGCEVVDRSVVVNDFQGTSVYSIFCAGETTGIGGLEKSLIEGRIAGLAAIGRFDEATSLFAERSKAHRFANALQTAFALRPELKTIASADTIVCRCEDVTLEKIQGFDSSRAAKLQTRCGMGPCQGRICGPALQFLQGWSPYSVRPPVTASRIGSLVSNVVGESLV